MYSGERRRYSHETKPEQYSPDTWDNPTKVINDLKRLGLSAVKLARRFAGSLINKLPQDPPRASSIE